MRVLLLVVCVLAVSTASVIPFGGNYNDGGVFKYEGPQHIPIITKEGVPENTLEVQHARAEHLAALSAEDVKGYNGYSIKQEHYPVKYHGPEHMPVITKKGVPEDTLEVQHAKAEHFAALSAADVKGYNGYTIKQEHYPTITYHGPEHIPVITKEGVPEDTLEVQHAKAEHYAALSAADVKGYNGYTIKQEHYPTVKYHGPEHIPVITKEGVPEDTLEVQHAKAEHLAALSAADVKGYNGYFVEQDHYPTVMYHGPEHIPVITKEGVPEDTLEVKHAKAEHLAALAAEKYNGFNGYSIKQEHYPVKYHGPEHIPIITKEGVPTETLEVQHAKANHLAAHAAEAHKNHRHIRSIYNNIPEDTLEVKLAKAEHFEALAAAKLSGFNGYTIKQEHYPTVKYHGAEHIPVITKEGVPEDTLEVQHAKAEHLAALSSADVKGYNGYSVEQDHYPIVKYHGPEHIPVITKEGVPEDTLEVKHARAEHLAAVSADKLNGFSGYSIKQEHYPVRYHGPEHIPILTKEGVPEDTEEVKHAKAVHFAALSAESNKHYIHRRSISHQQNVPEDTLEVKQAKAEHFAAHAAAEVKGFSGYSIKQEHYPTMKYHGPQHIPVITKEGVPEETAEVKQAKSEHLAAHSLSNHITEFAIHQEHYPTIKYQGTQHIPVITKEGVPEETAEVEELKAQHFAALSSAEQEYTPLYGYNLEDIHELPVIAHNDIPADTDEVQHAKLAHFAAIQEAQARNDHTKLQYSHHF